MTPAVRKFTLEFEENNKVVIQSSQYSHQFHINDQANHACVSQNAADSVKRVLDGEKPIRDRWHGNEWQSGLRGEGTGRAYNLKQIIKTLEFGRVPAGAGEVEAGFWLRLGLMPN